MNTVSVLFFGSTADSVIVLESLAGLRVPALAVSIAAVVTQPPRPVGRKRILTRTPVEEWATAHGIPCLSFPAADDKPWLFKDEQTVIDTLEAVHADLIVSASFGQKIPAKTISDARYGGLNIHPSVLPRWRGGDPVPWAILTGDRQTGVTVVSLSERFDEGLIYAQEKVPITGKDVSAPLRTRLFRMGAVLLNGILPDYVAGKTRGVKQHGHADEPRATRLSRELGYEPWETVTAAMTDTAEAGRIERKWRAFHPWPGLWTTLHGKRVKLLDVRLVHGRLVPVTVQMEGKQQVSWEQFGSAYLPEPVT